MLYFLWRFLRRSFWMRLASHWSDRHDQMYFGEWEQKKNRIRNYRTYQLIGAKNPGEQEA